MPILVFEYVKATDFKTLFPTLSLQDIKIYMFQLFVVCLKKLKIFCRSSQVQGLALAHQQGIMHRDIKPHNVVIDHKNRELRIIDW